LTIASATPPITTTPETLYGSSQSWFRQWAASAAIVGMVVAQTQLVGGTIETLLSA
jgi:hypothetical protein